VGEVAPIRPRQVTPVIALLANALLPVPSKVLFF